MDRGNRLGGHHTDDKAADQAGTGCRRNTIQIREGEGRFGHRCGNHAFEPLKMGAGGDFGHDAAIGPMGVDLGHQALAADGAIVADHRRRRFIATGLNSKDNHQTLPVRTSRPYDEDTPGAALNRFRNATLIYEFVIKL
jgi:hypothetical protein